MKKVKQILTLMLLTMLCGLLSAQEVKLSGYVVSEGSRDRIADANLSDVYSGKGTSSNEYGYYEMTFKYGDSVLINVSHISYTETMFALKLTKHTHFDIIMKQGHTLSEVTVTEKTPIEKRLEVSTMRLTGEQIKYIPSIGGEPDIMRAFQMMPGVGAGNESRAGISVRGGDFGQNLYVLDGTPLFSVNHIGGILSTFDADIIERADLIKGGFPANYGGRLSSVMEVETHNVDDMTRGNLTIGLLNCKFSLGGPLKNKKTSMLFSIRRFMYDLIMYPVSAVLLDDQKIAYTFWDFNFKINHKFNDKNTLSFGTYIGDDIYKLGNDLYGKRDVSRFRLSGGNKMASLKWDHKFDDRTGSRINLSLTDYHSSSLAKFNDTHNRDSISSLMFKNAVNIMDLRLAVDINWKMWGKSVLRAGITESLFVSMPYSTKSRSYLNDSLLYEDKNHASHIYSNETSAYILGEMHFGKYVSSNIGFRMVHYYDIRGRKSYWQPEPRALVMFRIPKAFTIKMAYSRIHQNIHCVTGNVMNIYADRWIVSTGKLQPAKSDQFDVGIARSFLDGMLETSIDAYYKKMSNLAMMKRNISVEGMVENITDLDLLVTGGNGKAMGIEFLLTKTRGSLTGFMGYSLSRNIRQFEGINKGRYFLADNDRTHSFSISLNWAVSNKFSISANWAIATGAPITVPVGLMYNEDGRYSYVYDGVSNYRMKPYHRLDVGFNFMKSLHWGERTLTLSVINVYNRKNPYLYYIGYASDQMYSLSIFPFMPALSYSVNFNKVSLIERGRPYLESQKKFQEIFHRHSIGFQINPYLGDIKYYKPLVFAGRYTYGIFNYLSVGAEFSGFYDNGKLNTKVSRTTLDARYGVLCRVKYPYLKYIHPFLEVSAYYGHVKEENKGANAGIRKSDYFSGYAAPGISLNMFRKRISFDFFYKFSPRKIIDNKYYVMTWRMNVNF
ncbi:MAG: TonB-dependent receptor [Bacteroidales bacterium]|nr:TonB-dependent receptor [Bacteroidales bacterium]